jgi:hypothetical protein
MQRQTQEAGGCVKLLRKRSYAKPEGSTGRTDIEWTANIISKASQDLAKATYHQGEQIFRCMQVESPFCGSSYNGMKHC